MTSENYALISVTDKTGIIDFAKKLSETHKILASGGTGSLLQENDIDIIKISDYTDFPELFDGRVKTLHPLIHGGILALDTSEHLRQMEENGIKRIDLVVCNLYDFQGALESNAREDDMIEKIDIGGPTLIRAAAKNYTNVAVLVDPVDYDEYLEFYPNLSNDYKLKLASKAFSMIAHYDILIAKYFGKIHKLSNQLMAGTNFDNNYFLGGKKQRELRYGENPHQKAAYFTTEDDSFYEQVAGKLVSYNNMTDMIAGWELVQEFDEPACTIIKHRTPCGVATRSKLVDAYTAALSTDPKSSYGGVYCFNRKIDVDTANELVKMFVDVLFAPDIDPQALEILKRKEKMSIVKSTANPSINHDIVSVPGGFIVQNHDVHHLKTSDCHFASEIKPSDEDLKQLFFAWKVVKIAKSNATVLVKDFKTVGIGSGEPNRVDAVQHAIDRAGDKVTDSYLASDAFFPFADSIEVAKKKGIKAIIVPSGSIRDNEVVEAANKLGVILVFTSVRSFKH